MTVLSNYLARPTLPALLVILIWGLNVVFMKIGINDMEPVLYTALRFALLSLLLLPFWRIPRATIRPVIAVALVMGIGHFGTLAIGISYVDSSVTVLILLLGAPLSSLLAFLFLNERMRGLQIACVVLAGCGAIAPTLFQGVLDIRVGALIVLFSTLMWAVGNLQIRGLNQLPLLTLQFWIGVISSPLCFLVYGLNPSEQTIIDQLSLESALSLLYVVLFSSIFGYWLWYQLINRHGINGVVNYVLVMPVVTMLAGYWLLDETLTPLQWIGAASTLLAMWAFYRAGRRPEPG